MLDKKFTISKVEKIESRQTSRRVKLSWDDLPTGSKILIHFENGTYVGVYNNNGVIETVYTSKIYSKNTGETVFGTVTENKEQSFIKEEKIIN